MYAGSINYYTSINLDGFQKGIDSMTNSAKTGGTKVKDIVAGLGISKIISTGISAIKNSADDAIKRVDTLNNYPKVLQNLGFDANEAKKSINELSDGLDGLPTTLDSATISVQRLVSKNGDLGKSTKYFLAMNNAILSGGASIDIQNSALEQLTQSYAKGKPDLMEWRTLQMAMPGQLKQVAQAMGYVSDSDLYDAFKDGVVSMDDFMNTLVKLNNEGSNNMASFKEQAKDATSGIATSVTNLKTAVTRGLANIINSVDKGMKQAGIGGINENIQKLSKNTSKVMNTISSKMPSVIKHIKTLSIALITAKASATTFKASLEITNIAKKFVRNTEEIKQGSKKIKESSEVMLYLKKTFNMLSSNPFALATTGVVALVGGMLALKSAADSSVTGINKINDTLDNYDKSMQRADKSRQEYLDKNMNEISNYESLYRELQLIVDENGKVKEGYEQRASFIAGKLNEALGTEISLTGNQINNYKEMRNQISSVIEQKRVQVLLEAQEEKYNTAKDNKVKLEKAYAEAIKESKNAENERNGVLDEIQKKYNLTEKQMKSVVETGRIYKDETGKQVQIEWDLANKLANVNNEFNSANRALSDTKNAYLDNQSTIGNYELAIQNLANGNYEAVLKMYEDTTNYQGKTREDTYNNYQASIEAQQQYLQDLKNGKGTFEEESRQAAIASTEAKIAQLQNEQAQYKSTIELGQNEAKAVWNTGLANQLSEITGHTIEFQRTADGNIQAYIDGVKQGGPMSKKEARKFANDMTDEIKKTKKESKKAGENVAEGFNEGIKNKKGSSFNIISNFGSSILSKFKASLKEHSPSKASEQDAEYFMEGFNIGLDKEKPNVLRNIDLIGDEIVDRMQNAVSLETGSINTKTMLQSNASYNSMIQINANFKGNVDIDGAKIGRVVAPDVVKTIKVGGLR